MFNLYGLDPHHPNYDLDPDYTLQFENIESLNNFIIGWLEEHLKYFQENQIRFYKDIPYHINKYMIYFQQHNILYFFGEYHNPSNIDPENPPLYIWKISNY